jgi:hypothetical protein
MVFTVQLYLAAVGSGYALWLDELCRARRSRVWGPWSTHRLRSVAVVTAGKYEQHYKDTVPGLNAQKLLAGMRDRGAGVSVMEMGTKVRQPGDSSVQTGRCTKPCRRGAVMGD